MFGFSSDVRDPEGANLSKGIASDIIGNKLFKAANNEQGGHSSGPLGTHSNRKLASTHTRRSGATKDERDIGARRKAKTRVAHG